jgi:hypothetical protein
VGIGKVAEKCTQSRYNMEQRKKRNKKQRKERKQEGSKQGHTEWGGCQAAAPSQNSPKPEFKKLRFCRYYGIKSFT